jgi:hypothetical protein
MINTSNNLFKPFYFGFLSILFYTIILPEAFCKNYSSKTCLPIESNRLEKDNALKQIRKFISLGDFADITNLQYNNGYSLNKYNYVVIAGYTTTFRMSIKDIQEILQQIDDNNKKENVFSLNSMLALGLYIKYGQIKAGDSYNETRSYHFIKTENGWVCKGEYKENEGENHTKQEDNNSGIGLGTLMWMMID